eukprot:341413-Prymnesium_polylepis.2
MAPMGVSPLIGLTNYGGVEALELLCARWERRIYSFCMPSVVGQKSTMTRIPDCCNARCCSEKALASLLKRSFAWQRSAAPRPSQHQRTQSHLPHHTGPSSARARRSGSSTEFSACRPWI